MTDLPDEKAMAVDERGREGSPSRSRSASYSPLPPSPLPPKSLPKQSPSRSPRPSKREISRSRSRGWSRSPSRSRSRSRSPSSDSRDRRHERRRSRDPIDAYSVQVRGLTRVVTKSHLEHIFAFYGSISDIVLPIFRITGENKGKGWIVYRSNASAQKAQEYMDGGQIDGAVISVKQEHMPEEHIDRQRGHQGYSKDNARYHESQFGRDGQDYSRGSRRGRGRY